MDWEAKTKLCQLGNKMNSHEATPDDKKEFQSYVLKNIGDFDNQTWNMFVTIIELIPSEMEVDIEFWKQVYPYIKDINAAGDDFNFRAGMRMALLQTFCDSKLNQNEIL